LFYKPHSAIRPDYYAKQTDLWILQPFEVTEWITTFSNKMKKESATKKDIQSFLRGLGYTDEQIAFVRRHFAT